MRTCFSFIKGQLADYSCTCWYQSKWCSFGRANRPCLHVNIIPGRGCRGLLSRLARAKEAVDLALLEAVLLLAHLPASPQPQTLQQGWRVLLRRRSTCTPAPDRGRWKREPLLPSHRWGSGDRALRILCVPLALLPSKKGKSVSRLLTWPSSDTECTVTPEHGVHAFLCSQSGCLTRGTGLATRCMAAGMVMIFCMALPRRSL